MVLHMCEILVCVKDRGGIRDPKRGDVIDVKPDGWAWGRCELGQVVPGNPNGNHNFFRIIKLPNVTEAQAENMLTPEVDVNPLIPSPYLQYRVRYLDITKIAALASKVLRDHWQDDLRADGFLTLNFTAAQINNVVSIRTPVPF